MCLTVVSARCLPVERVSLSMSWSWSSPEPECERPPEQDVRMTFADNASISVEQSNVWVNSPSGVGDEVHPPVAFPTNMYFADRPGEGYPRRYVEEEVPPAPPLIPPQPNAVATASSEGSLENVTTGINVAREALNFVRSVSQST